MLISQGLTAQAILLRAHGAGSEDVIRRLAPLVARALGAPDEALSQAVLVRERTRSTALPNGSAIPHCRMPGLPRFGIGVATFDQPAPWDDAGRDVATVFLIAAPSESISDHMRVLANSSQMLDSVSFRLKLRSAPTPELARDLIATAEKVIEERRARMGALREVRPAKDNGADKYDELVELVNSVCW